MLLPVLRAASEVRVVWGAQCILIGVLQCFGTRIHVHTIAKRAQRPLSVPPRDLSAMDGLLCHRGNI